MRMKVASTNLIREFHETANSFYNQFTHDS